VAPPALARMCRTVGRGRDNRPRVVLLHLPIVALQDKPVTIPWPAPRGLPGGGAPTSRRLHLHFHQADPAEVARIIRQQQEEDR
jgi:hypothetical protein